MVDDQENQDPQEEKEDSFDFDATGEAAGYISQDQARVLAMQAAAREPGAYGQRLRDVPMAFDVKDEEDTEDHYVITLSFRPQGEFRGESGQEQFFIEKEGEVAHRQVLSLPRPEGRKGLRVALIIISVAIIGVGSAAGVVIAGGGLGGDDGSSLPTLTPAAVLAAVVVPTDTPSPTATIVPTQAPTASPSPTILPTRTLEPTMTPTITPAITRSPTQTHTATIQPTDTPTPTSIPTKTPTRTPTPPPTRTPTPTATIVPLTLADNQGILGVYFDEADRVTRSGRADSIQLIFDSILDPNSVEPSDFAVNGVIPIDAIWATEAPTSIFLRMPTDLPTGQTILVAVIGEIADRFGTVASNLRATLLPLPTPTQTPTTVPTSTPLPAITPTPTQTPIATPSPTPTQLSTVTPSPTPAQPVDSDNDGLSDLKERDLGTNPFQFDTDFDGLSDADEIKVGADPFQKDTDGDEVVDGDDLIPLFDAGVRIKILRFEALTHTEGFGGFGDPYFVAKVEGSTQRSKIFHDVELVQDVEPFEFNISDDQRVLTFNVYAWDSDFDSDDQYDISSVAAVRTLTIKFDILSRNMKIQDTGAVDGSNSDGPQGEIVVLVESIALGSIVVPTPTPLGLASGG